jgi:hypothetical protein
MTNGPAASARARLAIAALAGAVVLLAAPAGRAQPAGEPRPYTPSIFSCGFDGFLVGAGAGLGGGYLSARAGGWRTDDWKALVYGASIGALTGGALGVGLGVADMANETQGRGFYVLRDGGLGLGFGAVTGALIGGLGALASNQAEHVLLGGSIGALAGTGVGLVLGMVEAQRPGRVRGHIAVTIAPAADATGKLAWMPALVGRY